MRQTRIRIGRIAIDGAAHVPSAAALGQRLQAAIAHTLRNPAGAQQGPLAVPHLRLTLPHGATESDIAAAVARALRAAVEPRG